METKYYAGDYTVLVALGTRPEAIKMLPVILALQKSKHLVPLVVSTGQHPGLVEDVLGLAGIHPDADLGVARPGLTLNGLFAAVMTSMEAFILNTFGRPQPSRFIARPSGYPVACFVHGDTTSAAASALTAFHLRIPIIHVEAGLRTSSILSPFPEELNRQLISRLANLHLAPTRENKGNLTGEGINGGKVFVTGNTAIDALHWATGTATTYSDPRLDALDADNNKLIIVVTAHRRENWGAPLIRIGAAIAQLADHYPEISFVVALHPNPAVADSLRAELGARSNVLLVKPMDYLEFARLLKRATLAITDSGGIQEEAPSVGTPVIVVRETTERKEGVEAGTLELVGTDTDKIVEAVRRLLDDPLMYAARVAKRNPYGDGYAAERIVAATEYIAFGGESPKPFGGSFDRTVVLDDAGYLEDPADYYLEPGELPPTGDNIE